MSASRKQWQNNDGVRTGDSRETLGKHSIEKDPILNAMFDYYTCAQVISPIGPILALTQCGSDTSSAGQGWDPFHAIRTGIHPD